jgi:hypothetical protein
MSGRNEPVNAGTSLARALARAGEWRYFVLFVLLMWIPTALAQAPLHAFFRSLFDTSTRSEELVSSLDSSALLEVVRQLGEPAGDGVMASMFGVMLTTAILAPLLAGGALALAGESGPLGFRSLLGEAAALYPRMLRMAIASCIPLGIAAGGAAGAFHFADSYGKRAVLESSASHASSVATFASVVLFWLANVAIESGRAHFAAEPERRSALGALWSGVKLAARHPRQVLGLCFVTTLLGVGGAAIVTAIRLRLPQSGALSIAFAFVVAQGAIVALAWGRASKLVGLADLIRADGED